MPHKWSCTAIQMLRWICNEPSGAEQRSGRIAFRTSRMAPGAPIDFDRLVARVEVSWCAG